MVYKKTFTVLSIAVYFAWTAIFVMFVVWTIQSNRHLTEELAISTARKNFFKDLSFRRWVTKHGGIYAPISDDTPPNPYLTGLVSEQNITTPKGVALTLMNPAYSIRQIMEQYETDYGIKGKITSLNPLNPQNAPTNWERIALEDIAANREQTGDDYEVIDFVMVDGEEHIQFLKPLYVEQGCLKCHGSQGYEIGDLRGGISVTFPVENFTNIEHERNHSSVFVLIIIWVIGIVLITVGILKIKEDIRIKNEDDQIIVRSLGEKEVLIKEIHHRVKNNLQIISSLVKLKVMGLAAEEKESVILIDTLNRIQTIAFIHEELYQSKNLKDINIKDHITTLYNNLAQTNNSDGRISFILECSDIYLDVNTAIPLGLLLNEVLTNSFKYAFPEERKGEIYISLKETGTREYSLVVADNGIGIPEDLPVDNPGRIGLTLINSLVIQLNGSIITKKEKGTRYEIRFIIPEDQ